GPARRPRTSNASRGASGRTTRLSPCESQRHFTTAAWDWRLSRTAGEAAGSPGPASWFSRPFLYRGISREERCRRNSAHLSLCAELAITMNWLTNYVLPKIRALTRKDVPDNLWKKCPACEQMLFHRELAANLEVCRHCGHHFRIGSEARFKILFDDAVFEKIETPKVAQDPLRFRDRK